LVEVRETVQEIIVPVYIQPKQLLFASISGDELLAYGIPAERLADVRQIADEESLLKLVDHLPKEAAEALLDLATGAVPKSPQPVAVADPFNHPDNEPRLGERIEVHALDAIQSTSSTFTSHPPGLRIGRQSPPFSQMRSRGANGFFGGPWVLN
jgi:hypothetical protein